MDVVKWLQDFESSMSSYVGEDPLDAWDKFVAFLEKMLPASYNSRMSVVFDRLVNRFINVGQYADDIRYVNYCIKCASYYSNPIVLYHQLYTKSVGMRTTAFYVAWAQQFEQQGMNEQADTVYQKAMENQAQPADTVLSEYRQFQSRTRSQTSAGNQNPLQTSRLTNQMFSHRDGEMKASEGGLPQQPKYFITVSRSETRVTIPSSQGPSVQMVSEYNKDELECEGSELCFEEVRAKRFFCKFQKKQQNNLEGGENVKEKMQKQEEGVLSTLEIIHQDLESYRLVTNQPSPQRQLPVVEAATSVKPNSTHSFGHPQRHNYLRRHDSGFHTEPNFIQKAAVAPALQQNPLTSHTSHHPSVLADSSVQLPKSALTPVSVDQAPIVQTSMVQPLSLKPPNQLFHRPDVNTDVLCPGAQLQPGSVGRQEDNIPHQEVSQLQEPEATLDVSQGDAAHLSHITPNNSLGFVQATPSKVLPSPTVNTREAMDVIMDMFQAPTLLGDLLNNTAVLHTTEKEADTGYLGNGGTSSFTKPAMTTLFTIFQDDNKENPCAAASSVLEKSKPIRALAVIPTSKPNETAPDLVLDECTMWGARFNSLNSCPNSTTDFAMSAHFVSTPFTNKAFSTNFFHNQENNHSGGDAEDDFIRHQSKKLSPIMENSPGDEKLSETAVGMIDPSSMKQGTIVGEGLSSAQHCLTISSITMVQPPPPAVLSFRDQTLCPTKSSAFRTMEPGWKVYTSPEQSSKQTSLTSQKSNSSVRPRSEQFKIWEDLDTPGSPEEAQAPASDVPMSPECAINPDWLAIKSPEVTVQSDLDAFLSPRRPRTPDVPMSPEQPQLCDDVPMSPMQVNTADEPMMSPDRGQRPSMDMSVNTTASRTGVQLVPDPWDNELISDLLSTLTPPLTSHPHFITWQCNLPNISRKMTLSMGKASLRVDCVLGEGAFATVYQATDPMTSEKVVLKVQKPANPWEFYINTQLDARLQPGVRRLYSSIHSAHLFSNGSVLVGELHGYGTLLNAVNIYKTLSDKVMPQPLVMYFTICILQMVEQLHGVDIIHADIKPDNFLLGERFMENKGFDLESTDHGLVLIDLGQSIDMKLFPEATAFTTRCLTSGFQCTEMLSGKPWNYQTDYFGIAGTVYCMLFGTYMQVTNEGGVWKTNAVFRRNPHSDLWLEIFHTLLNVPDCSSVPSLRSLRCKLTSMLQQNYSSKLSTLKSRLVVLLLENRRAARN